MSPDTIPVTHSTGGPKREEPEERDLRRGRRIRVKIKKVVRRL